MRRIGILTSGGDCQALNATMRGVAKSLYNMLDDVEIIGFEDGYKGLMYADYQIMKPADFPVSLLRAEPFWEHPDSHLNRCAFRMRVAWIRLKP